jgi:uncharacterized integral membrane protein
MSARNEAVGMPVENQRNIGDWIKLIVGVLGGAALIIFFLQNRQEVNVNFLWMEWTTGLIWALLASAVLGALSAVAFATIRARRRMG